MGGQPYVLVLNPMLLLCMHACSVPAFKTEWYWKQLESGNKEFVEFHNRVYGCSGVMPDKYPCTGFEFKWVHNSTLLFPKLLIYSWLMAGALAIWTFIRYADFAPMFKAEMFDPDQWASIFKKAGAQCNQLWSLLHGHMCFYCFLQMLFWRRNIMRVGAISVVPTTGTGIVWTLVPKWTSLVTLLPVWGLQASTWDYTTASGSGSTLSTWRTMLTTALILNFRMKCSCLRWWR